MSRRALSLFVGRGILGQSLFTLILISRLTSSASESGASYRYDSWKTEEGLPQNAVKAILQTKDGYLWLSTRFGVARFDGLKFKVFDRENTRTMERDSFTWLAEDARDQRLWLGDGRGVTYYRNRAFKSFTLFGRDDEEIITAMGPAREGGIWIGTVNRLARFENEKLKPVAVQGRPMHGRIDALLEDKHRVLWLGTPKGLSRLDLTADRIEQVWSTNNTRTLGITSIFADHSDALWVGTIAGGLLRSKDGVFTTFDTSNSTLQSNDVRFITEDSDGNLWICLGNGKLARFREGHFDSYGKDEGLSDDSVMCLHADHEGNLWVGTEFGGLNRMQLRRLKTYSVLDGLGHESIWTICLAREGGFWIGTEAGLSRFRDGKSVNHLLGEGPDDNEVKTVLEDREGNVWAGTKSRGIRIFRDGVVRYLPATGGTNHDQVNALYEDRSGAVWVGTYKGLNRYENGILARRYLAADGLPHEDVRGICGTTSGDLWIATYGGGVSRMRQGTFTNYTTRHGLADNVAWIIHEDQDQSLWIGTEKGLTRMKDGTFSSISHQGLFDPVINDVLDDRLGGLWIGCNRAIFRVEKQQLIDVLEKRAGSVDCISYGVSDGMRRSETNGENQPAACRAPDGTLWFPTTDGVVVIDPARTPKNELPPPVAIEVVKIDEQEFDPAGPVAILPPGKGEVVEFRFTANSLTATEKVMFKCQLEGWDKDWSPPISRREAYYTNLRPRQYKFRVIACNNHGVWSQDGASFEFRITPHFYETIPFYIASALTLLAIGYGIHRLRVNVVKKIERLERQAALEKERARIANEMHDDLGSSLTQIALTSELASRELSANPGAAGHVASITSTAREVFRAMDEIVWAVNPKHDTLDSLVAYVGRYCQRFLGQAEIRCRLDLPDQLPPFALTAEERHNLFLAVKEGLNNIVKHASAKEVWIRAALDNGDCVITIQDDGRGFDTRSARPDGNGLNNMRDRMIAVGGRFEIETGENVGTTLKMYVRLRAVKTNGKPPDP